MIKAIFAGFLGCLAILLFLNALPLLGAPHLNSFRLLSTVAPIYAWWAEPLEFFFLGSVVFPVIYCLLLYADDLPGKYGWQKGLAWGLILWLLREALVSPVMGHGFFAMGTHHPIAGFIATLGAHVIYGLILGTFVAFPLRKSTVSGIRKPTPSTQIRR